MINFFSPELWIFISTLMYFLINGAGIFETLVQIPKWSSNPPESLNMFRGKYALDMKDFWIVAHSLHEITWVMAIVLSWNQENIRNWLLILFLFHFLVRVWTLMYFAPNVIDFQAIANGKAPGKNLLKRTQTWKTLNLIRTGLFIIFSIGMAIITFGVL